MPKMKGLLRIESLMEQLVEEPFMRLFAGTLLPQEVASRFVRALERSVQTDPNGRAEIAGRYHILLHPEDLQALQDSHPDLETALTTALTSLVRRMPIRLRCAPHVDLQADPNVPRHDVRILPQQETPTEERTRDLDVERVTEVARVTAATGVPKAYLLLDGRRVFDLQKPLIRIGRALDNDLIIENAGVSRHHAQLRLRYGRFMLQDLDSSAGTTVNGQPVHETLLQSGDLIALAGVKLLYVGPEALRHSEPREHRRPEPAVNE